jgi:glycosyltransferase involved in cell wall biosynthesis
MRVLLCHAYYQQWGGEDQSFEAEARLLESRGHEVLRYTLHNDSIEGMGRLTIAAKTFWNRSSHRDLTKLLRDFRPDVLHCTNNFPLISPSAYYAAKSQGVAVVQSLRNYRQLCPGGLLLREGAVCEDCLGKWFAAPAIRHGCYRGSHAATAVIAGMTALHRLLGTWSSAVDLYFTLSEFARSKFVAAGWPAEKIAVKPNFLDPDPGIGDGTGGYAVFVGRLSPEKGIATMLEAWHRLPQPVPLKVIGDGPLAQEIRTFASDHPHVELLGRRPLGEVLEIIGSASFLVMPSIWYETFGRTIIEAFAKGTPVIASRLGAMTELVEDGKTGLLFTPGDATDLTSKILAISSDDAMRQKVGRAARTEFERRYTAEPNHQQLLDIYQQAIRAAQRQPGMKPVAVPSRNGSVRMPPSGSADASRNTTVTT